MKLLKTALLFFAVMPVFVSCATLGDLVRIFVIESGEGALRKAVHRREIRAEMRKYAGVLYPGRTKTVMYGRDYSIIGPPSTLRVYLYLRPGTYSRETVTAVRDGLVAFFERNTWEARGMYGYWGSCRIEFILGKGGKTVYILKSEVNQSDWEEHRLDSDILPRMLRGKTIRNEELDTLLGRHTDCLDMEQSVYMYNAVNFDIDFRFVVREGYDPETIVALGDGLADFFDRNRQKLTDEYGRFDMIQVFFFIERNRPILFFFLDNRDNKWVWVRQ
ncbi:MAG: hypothetical protein LBH44_01300 [Treponema sp.]|jgi:hypothetical protein|nr:hypothetical protein [Treponema sp.]